MKKKRLLGKKERKWEVTIRTFTDKIPQLWKVMIAVMPSVRWNISYLSAGMYLWKNLLRQWGLWNQG
jgi:hypothetical protein